MYRSLTGRSCARIPRYMPEVESGHTCGSRLRLPGKRVDPRVRYTPGARVNVFSRPWECRTPRGVGNVKTHLPQPRAYHTRGFTRLPGTGVVSSISGTQHACPDSRSASVAIPRSPKVVAVLAQLPTLLVLAVLRLPNLRMHARSLPFS